VTSPTPERGPEPRAADPAAPAQARPGSSGAEDLLPIVYEELRRLARARLSREPAHGAGQTLQPTALVHEAYLRLLGADAAAGSPQWKSPGHFFGAAALAMRRILVERARERRQHKRGRGWERVSLSGLSAGESDDAVDLLALDEALTALEAEDRRKSEVVALRYFAGLSLDQTAEALGSSLATVKRDWAYARAWLFDRINPAAGPGPTEGPGTQGASGEHPAPPQR
jgi:RNA polymerase sigma factor (TIGR02999 family)